MKKKKYKEKFKTYRYYSCVSLVIILFILIFSGILSQRNYFFKHITVNSTITSHISIISPTNKISISPITKLTPTIIYLQGNCPSGYYYYENDAYSICFPQSWNVTHKPDNQNADGKWSRNITSFTNGSYEEIKVIPNFEFAYSSTDPCLTSENITVDNFSAIRLVNKDTSATNVCGITTSYSTIVKLQNQNSITIYYQSNNKLNLSKTDYIVVEQSLKIK